MDTNLGRVVLVKDIYVGYEYGRLAEFEPDSILPSPSFPYSLVEFKDRLYFAASNEENGRELFVSDGTPEGTQLVADLYPGVYGSYPGNLVESDDKLYFTADDEENGRELFVTDGTAEGTQLLMDLAPGQIIYGYDFTNLVEFNDKLYFTANDGESGNELFVSDGTAEGTQLLVNLAPGKDKYGPNNSYIDNFIEFNDKLYFTADDGESGRELFVSDGTAEGTQLLVDLAPGENKYGPNGSGPANLVEFNDKLYFTADDGESGNELFVSDGTAEGTQLLVNLAPGKNKYGPNNSYIDNFIKYNGKLYFTADDGESGRELFVSDGTAEGTQLVANLAPGEDKYGPNGSYPGNLVESDDKLYFTADDGENGRELFVSDGTAEGTQLLTDLAPGGNNYGFSYGSDPANLVEFNDKLYFTADDGENGRELFVSDGTAEGTQLLTDLYPGENSYGNYGIYSYSSKPEELTVVGDELFFRATSSLTGNELFKLTFDDSIDATPIFINGSEGSDNLLGSDRTDYIQALGGQDTVDSCGGDDFIDGSYGDDRLISNTGDDNLIGGNGKDTLNSGNGRDTLWGGNGNDILRARSGDDILTGGSDNDLLDGGIGNDTLDGLSGDDIFVLKSGAGSDRILDFNLGSDRLGLAKGLQFDDLSFVGQTILAGEEVLVTLDGINTEQLTSSDFKTI
jgi:ELWxxDGT repeat protein